MSKLCSLDQLLHNDTKTIALLSDDQAFIVIKESANIIVYMNNCPHLNKKLTATNSEILDAGQNFIRCARHDALFTTSQGLCIKGPCNGQRLIKVDHIIRDNDLYATKACR